MNETGSTNHHGGHEKSDASPLGLAIFAISMAVTLVLVSLVVWGFFVFFAGHQTLGPPASPFTQARPMPAPDQPRLQVAPSEDIHHMFDQQKQLLNTYGWVNQKEGWVRIPIDRAMDLTLQRGLPVREIRPAEKGSAGRGRIAKQGKARPQPGG